MLHPAKEVLQKNIAPKASPRIEQSLLAGVAGDGFAFALLVFKEVGHRIFVEILEGQASVALSD